MEYGRWKVWSRTFESLPSTVMKSAAEVLEAGGEITLRTIRKVEKGPAGPSFRMREEVTIRFPSHPCLQIIDLIEGMKVS